MEKGSLYVDCTWRSEFHKHRPGSKCLKSPKKKIIIIILLLRGIIKFVDAHRSINRFAAWLNEESNTYICIYLGRWWLNHDVMDTQYVSGLVRQHRTNALYVCVCVCIPCLLSWVIVWFLLFLIFSNWVKQEIVFFVVQLQKYDVYTN